MSKRLSTQRSLAAALSNENTSAAPAAASPTGPKGSGATSQALVVAQPPLAASPAASPEPKRSRRAEPTWEEFDFDASQPGFFDKLNPDKILSYIRVLFSLLGRSLEELWPPKPLTTTLTESSIRSLLKEALEQHVAPIAADVAVMGSTLAAELPLLSTATSTISTATSTLLASSTATTSTSDAITAQLRDIDQRLKDDAIAIEVLQNTAGLTAQAVKDIAAKPASAGLAGDAPPITTWADMLKQHTTSTTSAVAAQLQRQTLDLREEAELAKRSLNVIVKNFKMEEGENSEKLARAFESKILARMGLLGEIKLTAHRLPRARGKAGPPPLLLTFKTPADKISFLRRRKRLEKTLFTLDDDLTLAQQQRRRELWPTYLHLRQTKAGQPVYWKGAAIYVGHKPWQATPPPRGPSDSRRPSLGEYSSSSAE
eukprot:jgi/Mesvir1/11412/Mv07775-RA.1